MATKSAAPLPSEAATATNASTAGTRWGAAELFKNNAVLTVERFVLAYFGMRKMANSANSTEVRDYFSHVVQNYSCRDVKRLIDARLPMCAPLLATVVNGIDLIGGMMLGFERNNSQKRATAFMHDHLGMTSELATMMYTLVRCGLSHEGVPKHSIFFFVYYDFVDETILYNDNDERILLNVTAFAQCYIKAIDRIALDVPNYLRYVPSVERREKDVFDEAVGQILYSVDDLANKIGGELLQGNTGSGPDALALWAAGHPQLSSLEIYPSA